MLLATVRGLLLDKPLIKSAILEGIGPNRTDKGLEPYSDASAISLRNVPAPKIPVFINR